MIPLAFYLRLFDFVFSLSLFLSKTIYTSYLSPLFRLLFYHFQLFFLFNFLAFIFLPTIFINEPSQKRLSPNFHLLPLIILSYSSFSIFNFQFGVSVLDLFFLLSLILIFFLMISLFSFEIFFLFYLTLVFHNTVFFSSTLFKIFLYTFRFPVLCIRFPISPNFLSLVFTLKYLASFIHS